MKRRKQ
jgi:hypothetical protein